MILVNFPIIDRQQQQQEQQQQEQQQQKQQQQQNKQTNKLLNLQSKTKKTGYKHGNQRLKQSANESYK